MAVDTLRDPNMLTVRVYNVHFGDAILIAVPDRDPSGTVTMRYVLIDVGHVSRIGRQPAPGAAQDTAGTPAGPIAPTTASAGGRPERPRAARRSKKSGLASSPAGQGAAANVEAGAGAAAALPAPTIPEGDRPEDLYPPVIDDVLRVLGDRPLDLYVMTHEHRDHVQGLLWAATHAPKRELNFNYAWFTASSAPDYGTRYPDASKQRLAMAEALGHAAQFLAATGAGDSPYQAVLEINDGVQALNNPVSTADCVDYLRRRALHPPAYVYRGCPLDGTHPFSEAKLSIWAPEADTTAYRSGLKPTTLSAAAAEGSVAGALAAAATLVPPSGVDAGVFYDLINMRDGGYAENIMAIDAANNNTSVVFCLEWHGWRLLFPGDAEQRSWQVMADQGAELAPVDFFKISHHGSQTGLPPDAVLDRILPAPPPGGRKPRAALSTFPHVYNGVPDPLTLQVLAERAEIVSIDEPGGPPYVDFVFPAER